MVSEYKKSSFCGDSACVEVKIEPGWVVRVREHRDPRSYLIFTPKEWAEFVAGVKAGEFDVDPS